MADETLSYRLGDMHDALMIVEPSNANAVADGRPKVIAKALLSVTLMTLSAKEAGR
jgi:hypothetical protein